MVMTLNFLLDSSAELTAPFDRHLITWPELMAC